jgi:hypothetical protein
VGEKKFSYELFLKAHALALKKSPKCGLSHFAGVPVTEVFFKYLQLDKSTKVEDFFRFAEWVRSLPNVKIWSGWHTFNSITMVEDEIDKHRRNLREKMETPSERGYWKMLKEIAKLPKKGYKLYGLGDFIIQIKNEKYG